MRIETWNESINFKLGDINIFNKFNFLYVLESRIFIKITKDFVYFKCNFFYSLTYIFKEKFLNEFYSFVYEFEMICKRYDFVIVFSQSNLPKTSIATEKFHRSLGDY